MSSSPPPRTVDALALQAQVAAFVRGFGLHQPDRTPCGQAIPVSEAHALAELDSHGPLPQHELCTRLRLEKSTVSRLVGQLHTRGWLHRGRRPADGRVVWLELTPAGRRAAANLAAARAAKFTALLDAIPPHQRQAVLDGLTILVEATHARDPYHPPPPDHHDNRDARDRRGRAGRLPAGG
jgi:DNA-binding MarR family transcriptional regulator